MLVLEGDDPNLYDRVQAQNLIRQYDLMTNCIEIGLKQGPTAFDKYLLWGLNHVAVVNISAFGGRFRQEPIYVGDHRPPHFKDVPDWMDRFTSNIQENWFIWSPAELAAYGLWRLNWIHPFVEGNGRTARAVCYYLLCVRTGALLPGRKILPERIKENRPGYEAALRAADEAWDAGDLDFTAMRPTWPPSFKRRLMTRATAPREGCPMNQMTTRQKHYLTPSRATTQAVVRQSGRISPNASRMSSGIACDDSRNSPRKIPSPAMGRPDWGW